MEDPIPTKSHESRDLVDREIWKNLVCPLRHDIPLSPDQQSAVLASCLVMRNDWPQLSPCRVRSKCTFLSLMLEARQRPIHFIVGLPSNPTTSVKSQKSRNYPRSPIFPAFSQDLPRSTPHILLASEHTVSVLKLLQYPF